MAGTVGFEPTHAEIKTQSLTTWRRPNFRVAAQLTPKTRHFRVRKSSFTLVIHFFCLELSGFRSNLSSLETLMFYLLVDTIVSDLRI